MPKGTKKQHFVPQLLLRQFADERERLFAYDMSTDRSFRTTVTNAGHQNHFLSVPALDGSSGEGAHYEGLFQAYEGPAMTAVRSIQTALASGVLPAVGESERRALSLFIAVQYVRTPTAREQSFQLVELMHRVLAKEIAARNGFDTSDPKIAEIIDRFTHIPPEKEAELHGEHMLQPAYIEDLARMFAGHVWLLGPNATGTPLYVADHPVAVHGHVHRPGRGLGPASYGAEVMLPLSSELELSLVERKFVQADLPQLQSLDGAVFSQLTPDNVVFQRSLQVFAARRFIYCAQDDFDDAKIICDKHVDLRDPQRARVEAMAFGKLEQPRRRR